MIRGVAHHYHTIAFNCNETCVWIFWWIHVWQKHFFFFFATNVFIHTSRCGTPIATAILSKGSCSIYVLETVCPYFRQEGVLGWQNPLPPDKGGGGWNKKHDIPSYLLGSMSITHFLPRNILSVVILERCLQLSSQYFCFGLWSTVM